MDEQRPGHVWEHAEERYQAGQEVRGVVTRVAQFGVFVQVEPGLEGIVYSFELGNTPAALAGFTPGQEMQLFVKSIDPSRKRLELSLTTNPMPLPLEERVLPPAARRSMPVDKQPGSIPSFPLPDALGGARAMASPACPTCQRQIQSPWKFCVYCGGALHRRCPACGTIQPDLPDARFCCECGVPIQANHATISRP
ncbi:MAG TPA: zinc ribbon domain-containing protein [Ktedonobacteraceae bacterium]